MIKAKEVHTKINYNQTSEDKDREFGSSKKRNSLCLRGSP